MKKLILASLLLFPLTANATELEVNIAGLESRDFLPAKYAKCVYDPAKGENTDAQNISPEISWNEGPFGTKSYAIIMEDPDVPADFSKANKQDETIPKNAKRRTFEHWAIVDIPGNRLSVKQNTDGQHAVNGLSHAAYDGPCPPFNDERVHEYNFTVYALDTAYPYLNLKENFKIRDVKKAIKGHILAEGSETVKFSNNPKFK